MLSLGKPKKSSSTNGQVIKALLTTFFGLQKVYLKVIFTLMARPLVEELFCGFP